MRLIRCYIEGFGALREQNVEFLGGLNSICAPNGAGKTTLAAFLQAMFYGFPKGGKSEETNPRRRWKPWQGERFGGTLEFEAEGRSYQVRRSFGDVPAGDEFSLYDLTGRKASSRFSKDLGRELFQLEEAAFARCILFSPLQSGLQTEGIRTRLQSLVEDTEDVNDFEAAVFRLQEKRKQLRLYRGSGGSIHQLQDRIDSTEQALEEAGSAKLRVGELLGRLELLENARRKTEAEITFLGEALDHLNVWEASQSSARERRRILDKRNAVDRALSELESTYPKGLPGEEACRSIRSGLERLHTLELQEGELSASTPPPDWTAPAPEEFQRQIRNAGKCQKLQEDRNRCKLTLEEQRELELLRRRELPGKDQPLEAQTSPSGTDGSGRKRKRGLLFCLLLAGAGLLAGLCVWAVLLGRTFPDGVLFAAGTALLLLSALVWRKRPLPDRKEDPVLAERFEARVRLERLEEKAEKLQAEYRQKTEEQERLGAEIERFLLDHDALTPGETYERCLLDLQRRTDRLITEQQRAKLRFMEKCRVQERISAEKSKLAQWISPYVPLETVPEKAAGALVEAGARYRALLQQKADLEEELDQTDLSPEGPAPVLTREQISERRALAEQKLQTLAYRLAQERQELNAKQRLADRLPALEDTYSWLTAQKQKQERTCRLLDETIRLLTEAREELSSRYLDSLEQNFASLTKRVLKDDFGKLRLTSELLPRPEIGGAARPFKSLSAGESDAVTLCMRVALIQTLFPKEPAFLILDDPFINLDDDRAGQAGALLRELAQSCQILYLTCSESRML